MSAPVEHRGVELGAAAPATWHLCPRWNEGGTESVPAIEPPSVPELRRRYVSERRPVLLRGLASTWKATREWTFEKLRERLGDRLVPLVRVKDGMLGYDESSGMDYERKRLGEFLATLEFAAAPEWFLTVTPSEHFPELLGDVGALPYCEGASFRDARISIGGPGTTTPIHREIADNLFTVIRGEKEVALFAPSETKNLASFGPLSGAPHISPVDPRFLERHRFPQVTRCKVHRCLVRSGDVLLIPRLWWHAVRTNEPTIAMGSWWAEGAYSLVPKAAIAYKRLFNVRT